MSESGTRQNVNGRWRLGSDGRMHSQRNAETSGEPETRRLLLSIGDSPPPFPGDNRAVPSSNGNKTGRHIPSHIPIFRKTTSTVYTLPRSLSDERLNRNDEVFVSYIPTSTRSMILPTTNATNTINNDYHDYPASSPTSLIGSRHPSTDSIPIRTFSFRSGSKKISRRSTRRSLGREWTSKHWTKLREIEGSNMKEAQALLKDAQISLDIMEQNSEKAKRCSKLSSGFAPLMIFGGLVFLCIGISALTNDGKDKSKLKNLSTAPIIMGIFMLILGFLLIVAWVGCRGRAKTLEKQLLHGSRRNSEISGNLIHALLTKLSSPSRRTAPSPSLPGVTLDGIDILKSQSDADIRLDMPTHRSVQSRDFTTYATNPPNIGNGGICPI